MDRQKLHVGCGPFVHEGWVNIDKSPSVLLSRFPALRRILLKLRLLTEDQARGFPPGVVFADVSKRLPAKDNSVEFIYSSHLIEHLSRWQCLAFIRECRRVLRPGGVVRFATPDLQLMIQDYLNETSPYLEGNPTPADAFCEEYNAYADSEDGRFKTFVKKFVGGDTHQWMYDEQNLTQLFSEAGFTDTKRCEYQQGDLPELDVIEFRERGLFMEAR